MCKATRALAYSRYGFWDCLGLCVSQIGTQKIDVKSVLAKSYYTVRYSLLEPKVLSRYV